VDVNAQAEGRDAAARFRKDHRLGVQPLGDLVAVIEQATGIGRRPVRLYRHRWEIE
jgi:hypothetical protein